MPKELGMESAGQKEERTADPNVEAFFFFRATEIVEVCWAAKKTALHRNKWRVLVSA